MNKTDELHFRNMRARILELEEKNKKLVVEVERLREALDEAYKEAQFIENGGIA